MDYSEKEFEGARFLTDSSSFNDDFQKFCEANGMYHGNCNDVNNRKTSWSN